FLWRRSEQVHEDFRTDIRQSAQRSFEDRTAQHEKSAHGIGKRLRYQHPTQSCAESAQAPARRSPLAGAPAERVASADYDFCIALLEFREHVGQQPLIVLQGALDNG